MSAKIDTAPVAFRMSLAVMVIGILAPDTAWAADRATANDELQASPNPSRFGRVGEKLGEIAEWSAATDTQRRAILDRIRRAKD